MRPKFRWIPWLLFLFSVPPAFSGGAAAEPRVVRYEPTGSDFKYVYGTMAPVATLRPGDVLDTRTADCFGGVIQKPGDSLSKVKGDNPLTFSGSSPIQCVREDRVVPGYNARSSWRKIIMPARQLDSESLTRRLKDRQVSQAVVKGAYELILRFSDGTVLHVEASSQLLTRVEDAVTPEAPDAAERPTKRQLEYLAFIAKYMDRFGRAPAESDIQRHFLVSAPSVNQMMQMLERRGFITRLPGVPRSIRICIDLAAGAR